MRITHLTFAALLPLRLAVLMVTGCGPVDPCYDPDSLECREQQTNVTDDGPATGEIGYQSNDPNVMLLVDRSGSMAQPVSCPDATCPSKWTQLMALGPYLGEVKKSARLGLAVFPSDGGDACSVDSAVKIPISDDAGVDQRILTSLQSMYPSGRTPVAAALRQVAASGQLDATDRDNVVVLLTDGRPNCVCTTDDACERNEAVAAVTELATRAAPIKIFVVGFGDGASAAAETLTAMAEAADQADIAGEPTYYQADTVDDLIMRLYDVAIQTRSCELFLDWSPDPSQLVVWLNDAEVPAGGGYEYDSARAKVTLVGDACHAFKSGANLWFDER